MDDLEAQVWCQALLSRGFEEEETRAISNRKYLLWAEARKYLGVSDQTMSGLSFRGKLISLKDELGRIYRPYRYDLKHVMALDMYRNSKHRGRQKPSAHKVTSVPVTINTNVVGIVTEEEVTTPGMLLD